MVKIVYFVNKEELIHQPVFVQMDNMMMVSPVNHVALNVLLVLKNHATVLPVLLKELPKPQNVHVHPVYLFKMNIVQYVIINVLNVSTMLITVPNVLKID